MLDTFICLFALAVSYLVRFEFAPPIAEIELAKSFLPYFLLIRISSFFIGKTFTGIIRFTSSQDTFRIFKVVTLGTLVISLLNFSNYVFGDKTFFIPFSIVVLEYLITLFSMIVLRIAVKLLYMELKKPEAVNKRVIIFGAGESGLITKQAINRDPRSKIEVIAFIDDDPGKQGKTLDGKSIYSRIKLNELITQYKVGEVIIAIPNLDVKQKSLFITEALRYGVQLSNPRLNNSFSSKKIGVSA